MTRTMWKTTEKTKRKTSTKWFGELRKDKTEVNQVHTKQYYKAQVEREDTGQYEKAPMRNTREDDTGNFRGKPGQKK